MRKNILIFGHNDATQFIDIYNQYTHLFDKKKYKVTVVYLTGPSTQHVIERTLAEEVIFFNMPKKNIRMLKIKPIMKMLALCRERKFEIVICHRFKPSYIMLWVNLWQKIPALIFVMHELGTMASFGRRLLLKALFSRTHMLLGGVSNAVRDDLRKSLPTLPKENIVTLYNVLDVDQTAPSLLSAEEVRHQLNLTHHDFVFCNLARLAPNKDQETLLKAFAMAKPFCPQAKLIIIGDGMLEQPLKQLSYDLNLNNDVIFTGFLVGGHRYMLGFDCFVLSSRQEAFGRVLIEAMMAKLPVIATRVHGIPEVLGDTNILIEANNVDMLANAMKQIYSASLEDRHQLGQNGYQRVLNCFSIPAFKQYFWNLPIIQSLKGSSCA